MSHWGWEFHEPRGFRPFLSEITSIHSSQLRPALKDVAFRFGVASSPARNSIRDLDTLEVARIVRA